MVLSNDLTQRMGSAAIAPTGAFEAGSFASFTLTYSAGYFGIDDTGSLKIVMRFASDAGRLQCEDPAAPNYVSVEASNGATLETRYDRKLNVRPWDKTLFIRVVRGFLREGDRILVNFGDRRGGSPGWRMQTFCEPTFEFKVLVDAFAAYTFFELPASPAIAIVAGTPARWKAVLPTVRRVGEPFALGVKAEDVWGNPTGLAERTLYLRPSEPILGLPPTYEYRCGTQAARIDGLMLRGPGDCTIDVLDEGGTLLATSNALRIVQAASLVPYWGDLHGQSEETIGTNSAREYHEFARDHAFLDAMSHQGNDFQVTTPFWHELNLLSAEFNDDGRFIVFPGYEWSGNTGLGGDRNVLYAREGRPIHRSSHALIRDLSDVDSDANSAEALFGALQGEDCVVFAHIGGRYADITLAHDMRLERAIEIHSDWGTFDWLLEDAFRQGYRVGIVANSDGHKGRPGASYPGASLFGAYGGLTCMLARELTREGLLDALRRRHHYATTGSRVDIQTRVAFARPAQRFVDDPNAGSTSSESADVAIMGDIMRTDETSARFEIDVLAADPIERIDIRNGAESIESYRPYGEVGSRLRVIWEGAEYRGRGRETVWDGEAELDGNAWHGVTPINRYNIDKAFIPEPTRVSWEAITTGGFGGFEARLSDPSAGSIAIRTKHVVATLPLAEIGREDSVFEAGGLGRRMRIFRLPDDNPHRSVTLQRTIPLRTGRDNALYVRITFEDGHVAWSSPIYIIP